MQLIYMHLLCPSSLPFWAAPCLHIHGRMHESYSFMPLNKKPRFTRLWKYSLDNDRSKMNRFLIIAQTFSRTDSPTTVAVAKTKD